MTCPFIHFCNCRVSVDHFVTHCLDIKPTGSLCEKIDEIVKRIHRLAEDDVTSKYHTPQTWYTAFVAMVVE